MKRTSIIVLKPREFIVAGLILVGAAVASFNIATIYSANIPANYYDTMLGFTLERNGENNVESSVFSQLLKFTLNMATTPYPSPSPVVAQVPREPVEISPAEPVLPVIQEVNITSGKLSAAGLEINNETSLNLNYEELLNAPLDIKKLSEPQILIVHTHASEAYTPSEGYIYTPSDPYRTEQQDMNIVRIGDEVENTLKAAGIQVIHDRTSHDFPSYNGSYQRCLDTVNKNLKKYPTINIVLDIHRDALVRNDGTILKVMGQADQQKMAQALIMVGTDQNGLEHPHWRENLKFALKLQNILVGDNPNLMRPLNIRKERFNGHTTTGSLLIEIGSHANTMEECLPTAREFAKGLIKLLS